MEKILNIIFTLRNVQVLLVIIGMVISANNISKSLIETHDKNTLFWGIMFGLSALSLLININRDRLIDSIEEEMKKLQTSSKGGSS